MDDIQRGKVSEAERLLAPEIKVGDVSKGLSEVVSLFQAGAVKDIEVIGANSTVSWEAGKSRKTTNLSYEVELTTGWLVGSVVVSDVGDERSITSAQFNRYDASIEALNSFTFSGKSVAHYVFFALVVAIPLFSMITLVVCARSKIRKKWLWIIFILLGFVTFRLNWSTGQINCQLLSFQLLGASVFKMGLYGPWNIGVAVPIGAIVFLLKRKQLILDVPPILNATTTGAL